MAGSYTLRVMTFNVRGSHHPDGENAWKRRAKLNVEVIWRYAPDLIGFQEFEAGNLRVYEKELAGYGRSLGPDYQNRTPAYNAIFWNPLRMELLEEGGFWLSKTPERRSRSWQASHVRSAHWARFRLVPEGGQFVHLNTHLDHVSRMARAEGAKLIARRLSAPGLAGLPAVLTGDFNCDPDSSPYRIFAKAGFDDAHLVAGNGRCNTFHRFRGRAFRPRNPVREVRIDWILARDGEPRGRWAVRSCTVVRDAEPPVYPSDHYPVVASLLLED